MKYITGFFFKFIIVFIVLYLILDLLFGYSFSNVFMISFLLAVFANIFSELNITINNYRVAKVIGLGFSLLGFLLIIKHFLNISSSLILGIVSSAILIAVSERFLHKYLINKIVFDRVRN